MKTREKFDAFVLKDRIEFEEWAKRMGYADENDVPLMKHAAREGWIARQYEIDALNAELRELRKDIKAMEERLSASLMK